MTDNSWIYENDFLVKEIAKPCEPLRVEEGVPVYSDAQIEVFGLPDNWGIWEYKVVEKIGEQKYVLDYDQEQYYSFRPIHRYSRLARFKNTLLEILGAKQNVPKWLLNGLKDSYDTDPDLIWDSIRKNLKDLKETRYINCIPSIIKHHGVFVMDQPQQSYIKDMELEFMAMDDKWKYLERGRKYFPNLRYVALKMLEARGYVFPFRVPGIRTKRKRGGIEEVWVALAPHDDTSH